MNELLNITSGYVFKPFYVEFCMNMMNANVSYSELHGFTPLKILTFFPFMKVIFIPNLIVDMFYTCIIPGM